MQTFLRLLLPTLIPSWRFFSTVAPSPRIEYTLLVQDTDPPGHWTEARKRPVRLSLGSMLLRLLWNPHWNESLFLVSLSERLATEPTAHSVDEIAVRLIRDLQSAPGTARFLRYRLVFVQRDGGQISRHDDYVSDPLPLRAQ